MHDDDDDDKRWTLQWCGVTDRDYSHCNVIVDRWWVVLWYVVSRMFASSILGMCVRGKHCIWHFGSSSSVSADRPPYACIQNGRSLWAKHSDWIRCPISGHCWCQNWYFINILAESFCHSARTRLTDEISIAKTTVCTASRGNDDWKQSVIRQLLV